MSLSHFFPVAQAIEALLHPWAEVVIHDLSTQTIAALFNNFSKRSVGEDSLLEADWKIEIETTHFAPYDKINWDGKQLKSTTAVLRDEKGSPIGLLCINLDISKMEDLHHLLTGFIKPLKTSLPKELFHEDWREKISAFVHTHLQQHHLTLDHLTKQQKKELVNLLLQEGAFRAKHAATYVGSVLNISRATVYKYLSELQLDSLGEPK